MIPKEKDFKIIQSFENRTKKALQQNIMNKSRPNLSALTSAGVCHCHECGTRLLTVLCVYLVPETSLERTKAAQRIWFMSCAFVHAFVGVSVIDYL